MKKKKEENKKKKIETITFTATQTRELSTEIELNSLAELNKIAVAHKTELSRTNPDKAIHMLEDGINDHNDNMHLILKSNITGNAISQTISQNSTPYESSPTLFSVSEASESSSEKSTH